MPNTANNEPLPGKNLNRSDEMFDMLVGAKVEARRRSMDERSARSEAQLAAKLEILDIQAERAKSHELKFDQMGDVTRSHRVSTARSASVVLSDTYLPSLFKKNGELSHGPKGSPTVEPVRMDSAIIAASRVAAAGAQVIIMPERVNTHVVPGAAASELLPTFFRFTEPAPFAHVPLGAAENEGNAPTVALPIKSANVDFAEAKSYGVRFAFGRKDWRDVTKEVLMREIGQSLTAGIARVADHALLNAIAEAAPAGDFSPHAAAAQGLAFDELRALVGTGATSGVDIEADTLRLRGIPAELTAEHAKSFIGAFPTSAVAIRDHVQVVFERANLNGGMNVTAWVFVLPLLPDINKFWTMPPL